MNELLKVNYDSEQPTVSGRELHEFLEIKTPYTQWFERMTEYGFEEGTDYILLSQKSETNNPKNPITTRTDHELTIPMAKELCMLQRNEKGKIARQYFLQLEEAWNSPEMIMNRALKMSNARVKKLLGNVTKLTAENQIMKPKADYYDELVDSEHLTNFRDAAKEFGMSQSKFIDLLLKNNYIYRDMKNNIKPYANYTEKGYFVLKDFVSKTKHAGIQTLITVEGKNLLRKELTM